MKKLVFIAMMVTTQVSHAWIENSPAQKPYEFKFKLKGDTFEYSRKAASYEEAFETAAQACFNHFKGKGKLSEERGLDIIDVCANPRRS